MRTVCLLLLLCFLTVSPVAAGSFSGVAPGARTIVTTTTPTPSIVSPQAVAEKFNTSDMGTLSITTDPPGAGIYLDNTSYHGTTPKVILIPSGTHFLRLVPDPLYHEYFLKIKVPPGTVTEVDYQFSLVDPVTAHNIPGLKTITTAPREMINRSAVPATLLMEENSNSCLSGQECLTHDEAGSKYQQGWMCYSAVCGHAVVNSQSVPKYCCQGTPKLEARPAQVPVLVINTLQLNATNVSHTVEKGLPAGAVQVKPGPEKDTGGILGTIFGIFSGWFGGKITCPPGTIECGNACADPQTDTYNCGGCGRLCVQSYVCSNGQCIETLPNRDSIDMAALPNVTLNTVIL